MDIQTIKIALLNSWSKDTCYPPMERDWSSKNPAWGQCYCTTLVVHDYFGGKILKTKFNNGTGHFWNLIDDKEIDLSRSQFDKNEIIPKPTMHFREEIENNPKYKEYNRRYKILKRRIEKYLEKIKYN
jgi:hypothetical protein